MSEDIITLESVLNNLEPAHIDASLDAAGARHSYNGLPKRHIFKELVLGLPTKKEQYNSFFGCFTPGQHMTITQKLGPLMVQKRGTLPQYVQDGGEIMPIWTLEEIKKENKKRKFTYPMEERIGMALHTLTNETTFANVATIYG